MSARIQILVRYARPENETRSDPTSSRPTSQIQPHRPAFGSTAPQPGYGVTQAQSEADAEALEQRNRSQLLQVFTVVADLVRTPSDGAQLKAASALESLAQTGKSIFLCACA